MHFWKSVENGSVISKGMYQLNDTPLYVASEKEQGAAPDIAYNFLNIHVGVIIGRQ